MAFQAPWTIPRKTRKRNAFIWPKDGKRTTFAGRLADIFTNSGPDIYVATHRGPHYGWDAPTRGQWSRWEHLNTPGFDPWNPNLGEGRWKPPCWARRGAAKKYDFLTRKYRDGHENMWSDVMWEDGAKTRDQIPKRFRTPDGFWHTLQPQALGQNDLLGWDM